MHCSWLQGSGAQVALVAMNIISHLTMVNENSIPSNDGRNWETGKPDSPEKTNKTGKWWCQVFRFKWKE